MSLREKLRKSLVEDLQIDKDIFLDEPIEELQRLAALYNIDSVSKIEISNELLKILEIKSNEYRVQDEYFNKISAVYIQAFIEDSDTSFDEDYLKNIEMEYERLKKIGQI
jgi:hypothetical protein